LNFDIMELPACFYAGFEGIEDKLSNIGHGKQRHSTGSKKDVQRYRP
jgi:hypothetical protein